MSSIQEEKKELRKTVRGRINLLSEVEKNKQSECCCKKILADDFYKECDIILSYSAMKNELNLNELMKETFSQKKLLALPKIIPGTSDMDFYFVDEETLSSKLISGNWGILEPSEISENKVSEEKLKGKKVLVLVPGVAFSEKGERLGHGKGFYDIYFSRLKNLSSNFSFTLKLYGVCFTEQVFSSIPSEGHDLLMDKIIFLNPRNTL